MSVFTMADLHLPISVNKPMDIFGARWQNYVSKIEKYWRAIVTDHDTVIIPGDISWAIDLNEAKADFEFINSLPGKKLIGKGNHDYWWGTMSKNRKFVLENGFNNIDFLFNNAYEVENFVICGTRGWYIDEKLQNANNKDAEYQKIVLRESARLKMSIEEAIKLSPDRSKEILVFLHFPPVFGSFICEEMVNILTAYDIKRCFFGHIHGIYSIPQTTEYKGVRFTLISGDYLNFIPQLIAE
ncbi:MAG: metallophosphoesterase [Clostridia bacterium]|nr:metallophosphoesterase [Clostridia bacterium]